MHTETKVSIIGVEGCGNEMDGKRQNWKAEKRARVV